MNIYNFDLLNIKNEYNLHIINIDTYPLFYQSMISLYYHGIFIYLFINNNIIKLYDSVENKSICISSDNISKEMFDNFWGKYRKIRRTCRYTINIDIEYIDKFLVFLENLTLTNREKIIKKFQLR